MLRVSRAALTACLGGLILGVIASVWWPPGSLIAGACALAALVPGLALAAPRTRLVCALLLAIGLGCLAWSVLATGRALDLADLGRANQDMIGMILGTAFIRLALDAGAVGVRSRLRGTAAVLRTGLVVHLLGAILNMVTLVIAGDRLSGRTRLAPADAALIARGYATAALWSPFWVVSAVAVSIVPEVNLGRLAAVGGAFAAVYLLLSGLMNARGRGPGLPGYVGFPFSSALLLVPALLAAVVLAGHWLLPDTPIPRLVLLAAVLVPLAVRAWRSGPREAAGAFWREGVGALPGSASEASLFVSAAVLAVGGGRVIDHFGLVLPVEAFTANVAWGVVVAIVLGSVLGLHPLVTIAALAGLVLPLHPDPTLFGVAIAWGWSVAAPVGPLSGITLLLSERYGLSNRRLVVANLPTALLGLGLAWLALHSVVLLFG